MKRIEDIRPVKKAIKPVAEPEAIFEPEELIEADHAESIEEPAENRRPRIKSLWLKIILMIFVVALITSFWVLSMYRAKAKISKETGDLQKDFDGFLDAIGNKDILALGKYINNFDDKTRNSLLVLQSTGQDIYCLSLLYPKNQGSQISTLSDGIRGAHLITSSYRRLSNIGGGKSVSNSNNWLDQVNVKLSNLGVFNGELEENLVYAKFSSREAFVLLNSSNTDLAGSEKKTFENLKKLSDVSKNFFNYLTDLPKDLNENLTFTGGKKSYLILFQNNAEIRPGGGFLGSFAKIDLADGKVAKIDFEKNIYTLDKEFLATGEAIASANEYIPISANLTLRDSNNSADFAQSAKNVMSQYQKETGEKTDGLIALDTTLFRNLLQVVGPIDMPEYNLKVTPENFLRDVQYQVEVGYYQDKSNWSENQPKKILADMMPKFLSLIFESKNQKGVIEKILQGVKEKHLLFYFDSPKLEDLADGINAAGKIHNGYGDFLYLSDANIGGLKSSLNTKETVRQNVEIGNSGSVVEKISIIRQHNGSYEWPDGVNNNYLRVYLPLSAEISSVDFISGNNDPISKSELSSDLKSEKTVEFGKSVVSFWQNTKPGAESRTDVGYKREGAINVSGETFDYQITIQKQPGIESFDWQLYLVYPEGWQPQNVEGYDQEKHQIILSETIREDSVFRLRFIRD